MSDTAPPSSPTPDEVEELRIWVARRRALLYKLGAEVEVHPGVLGQMLLGRRAMPADVAQRVREALAEPPR